MDYGITICTPIPFAEAMARVRNALKAQRVRGAPKASAATSAPLRILAS